MDFFYVQIYVRKATKKLTPPLFSNCFGTHLCNRLPLLVYKLTRWTFSSHLNGLSASRVERGFATMDVGGGKSNPRENLAKQDI